MYIHIYIYVYVRIICVYVYIYIYLFIYLFIYYLRARVNTEPPRAVPCFTRCHKPWDSAACRVCTMWYQAKVSFCTRRVAAWSSVRERDRII